MDISIRKISKNDLMLLYTWANDPLIREMSFNQAFIPLETHKEWFSKVLLSSEIHLFVVEDTQNHSPVGLIRIDADGEIGISISKEYRGLGISSKIIELGIKNGSHHPKLIAHIKPNNIPSIKAFEKVGFRYIGIVNYKGNDCLEYIYDIC